jgi:hypothetical protein
MATVRIPLTSDKYPGLYALIDEEDLALVSPYAWHPSRDSNHKFYAVASAGRRSLRMHRLIMAAPPRMDVDHRDMNPLNNTRANLRLATRVQNMRNTGPQGRNRSGYKGVSQPAGRMQWQAHIRHDGKNWYLGSFSTPEEAAHAYDARARERFGHFARLNFPA